MINERLPVLTEDHTSLDWREAEYAINLKRVGQATALTVEHRTKGASSLTDAVYGGQAKYVTEIRSPRSLFSSETTDFESSYRLAWDSDDVVDDQTFIVGGVVSNDGANVRVDELHEFFSIGGRSTVTLPHGWWVAKALICRLNPLLSSLITFVKSSKLEEGTMSVAEAASSGSPKFYVHLPPLLFAAVHDPQNRPLRIAALIGVFARIPNGSMSPGGELASHPITKELLDKLDEAGVPNWIDDESEFDPALAATALEPFLGTETESTGAEDGDEDDSQ